MSSVFSDRSPHDRAELYRVLAYEAGRGVHATTGPERDSWTSFQRQWETFASKAAGWANWSFADVLSAARRLPRIDPIGALRQTIEEPHKPICAFRCIELLFQPATHKKGYLMSTDNTFLAVFLGSKTSPRMTAWLALPESERRAKEKEGMGAWKAWVEKHHAAIVGMGGPLGKTKKVNQSGIADISNEMGAFTVVRADSHEAAARLFENHPHFTIFPGESVEVMPVLPIPGG